MTLEALLVTQDAELLSAIRAAMEPLGIKVEVRSDAASALEVATRRRFDALIIDCDDLAGAALLLTRLRQARSSGMATIFGVVNGVTSAPVALSSGANFVLSKPVTAEYAGRVLQSAIPPMRRERRRYFRYSVEVPIEVRAGDDVPFRATMMNISEGGLAIGLLRPFDMAGVVGLEFEIPSTERSRVQVRAEVTWSDGQRAGFKLLHMSASDRERLQAWLNALEASEVLNASPKESSEVPAG